MNEIQRAGETRRVSSMVRFTIFALLLLVAGQAIALNSPTSIFAALRDLGLLALSVPLAYYLIQVLRWVKGHVLWKVRNRIIVSYLLVGLLPLVLLGLIGWLSMAVIFKQLSAIYLATELESVSRTLADTSGRIVLGFQTRRLDSAADLRTLLTIGQDELSQLPSSWGEPLLEVFDLQSLNSAGAHSDGTEASVPDWVDESFQGFVRRQEKLWLASAEVLDAGAVQALLVLALPLEPKLLTAIERRTSMRMQLIEADQAFAQSLASFGREQDRLAVSGAHLLTPVDWASGSPEPQVSILLSVPISTLLDHFFVRGGTLLGLLVALLALFLAVELAAVFVAVTMARSITRSVASIYQGLGRIQEGDFDVRIPAGDRNQLDAMADSFNRMAASIQRLMGEVSEKELLAKEVEIATQVQKQLFPQQLPSLEGAQVAAICIAARQVSGDYYDFIPYAEGPVDIIFGDISGKGISAALTMASTQSSLRSQLLNHPLEDPDRLASTMSKVSRQLYHQSRPQTYSTAVLAQYDSSSRQLEYCNAGHNPPLLFSDDQVERLDCGGTVVGLVQVWDYQQGSRQLAAGDLLLLYTDGVTEAVDESGEEFGEQRLIELVRTNTFLTATDIQELIVSQVFEFCGDAEQADDITIVCLKVE